MIQAIVKGENAFDVTFNISNATTFTTNITYIANKTLALLIINYTPTRGEYPNFDIKAIDSKNLTTSTTISNIKICDCKSLDASNNCLYDQVLSVINPSISVVSCQCLQYYKGKS